MSFISVAAGQPIRATHVQQFASWLTGLRLDTPGTIACTSGSEYAVTVRSQETTAGLALAVQYGSSGAPVTVAAFNKTGVSLGVAGTATLPTLHGATDTNTGLNWGSTSGALSLVSDGQEVAINKNATTALVYARRLDGATAGMISVTQADSNTPIRTTTPALGVVQWSDANEAESSALESYQGVIAGTGGGMIGGKFTAEAWTGWSPGTNPSQITGLVAVGQSRVSGAGVWGANIFATAYAGASGVGLCGIEVDMSGISGSTLSYRYGVQVVSPAVGVVQGSGDDVGFRIASKNATGLFKHGLLIDTGGGYWPMSTAGTLIATRGTGTTAHGIDFSATTFGTDSLYVPGLRVSGSSATMLSNDASATPAARVHIKDTTPTVFITESDSSTRFNAQINIRGATNTNKRLYFGLDTTDNWGIIQSVLNGTGSYPLVLQPIGGVVVCGDPTNAAVTPDTSVQMHVIGYTATMVAMAFDSVKTSTSATGGSSSTIPSQPLGYLSAKVGGTEVKFPYYSA